MSFVRALFCGPGAIRALARGRCGAVELVFDRCAYVRLDSDWLLVAEPDLSFGPLSMAVAGFDRLDLELQLPVRVTSGRLVLGSQVVSLERMRKRGGPSAIVLGTASAIREACTAVALPDPAEALRHGLAALAAGRVLAAVRSLAGVGEGLTPAGDDVLAGYAAARAVCGAPVILSTEAAGRSSPVGLAYLRCAERGELPDVAARVLAAIRRGSPSEVAATVPALSTWGATSGIALGWGLVAGVNWLARAPYPAEVHSSPPSTGLWSGSGTRAMLARTSSCSAGSPRRRSQRMPFG
ncbi:MAG: DUF2877 domain-containing protein [Solirubrobacterales bacterium]|nr:DUF2877 domain-containing protein [Solirubrobacterales bacterium]